MVKRGYIYIILYHDFILVSFSSLLESYRICTYIYIYIVILAYCIVVFMYIYRHISCLFYVLCNVCIEL